MSVNRVILVGRLGADPEIKSTQSGSRVANLRLSTSESWRDKNSGERKEKTEWHRVTIWNEGLVKVVEQYAKKGAQIYVCGQLQTRKWTDQSGVEKYSTEVVLQGFKAELHLLGGRGGNRSDDDGDGYQSEQQSGGAIPLDDAIPFSAEFR